MATLSDKNHKLMEFNARVLEQVRRLREGLAAVYYGNLAPVHLKHLLKETDPDV